MTNIVKVTDKISLVRTIGDLKPGDMFMFGTSTNYKYMMVELSDTYFNCFKQNNKESAYVCLNNGEVYSINRDFIIGPEFDSVMITKEY